MYYNCGIATAKRQTKLKKLHFIIQYVCPRGPAKTDYDFSHFPDFFLTTLQFPDFVSFPGEWSI